MNLKPCDGQFALSLLNEWGIAYEHITHEPVHTMEDLIPVEQKLNAPFFRNLFLCNRQKTESFLLLIEGNKAFRTSEVSKKIGKSRLSFGGEEQLLELLGVRPGAANPVGLVFDVENKVTLVVDKDIFAHPMLCLHPCVNTESVVISSADLKDKLIPNTKHEPIYIEITGEQA